MIRGTTPTHRFELPFSTDNVAEALVVYKQNDKEILRKTVRHCHMDGKALSVDLTQEETFRFCCNRKAKSQARVLTTDGKVWASPIVIIEVGECLTEDILGGGEVTPPSETVAILGTAILGTMRLA